MRSGRYGQSLKCILNKQNSSWRDAQLGKGGEFFNISGTLRNYRERCGGLKENGSQTERHH